MRPTDPVEHTEEAPSRMRKGIYVLPNLFTLAALFGGFYAIVMAMNNQYESAAIGCLPLWCLTVWTAGLRA